MPSSSEIMENHFSQPIDSPQDLPSTASGSFAQEFRSLARQRRFGRTAEQAAPARREVADDHLLVGHLAQLTEQLAQTREQLAVERARADRAELEVHSASERIMAARGLVHQAQTAAQRAVERSAFLDGRCQALEQALDTALNSSLLRRSLLRRSLRRRAI